MRKEDVKSLALALAGPMVGGQLMGLLCAPDVIGRWYTKLIKKPRWNPPNWVFGTVWPLLYVSQSVASWLVWKNKGANRKLPLTLYAVQMVLNLAWQPLFFKLHRTDIALVDSAAMLGVATAATYHMVKEAGPHKAAVAALMTPYVAWLAFATALTGKIHQDNPNARELTAADDTLEQKGETAKKQVAGAVDKAGAVVDKAGEKASQVQNKAKEELKKA